MDKILENLKKCRDELDLAIKNIESLVKCCANCKYCTEKDYLEMDGICIAGYIDMNKCVQFHDVCEHFDSNRK